MRSWKLLIGLCVACASPDEADDDTAASTDTTADTTDTTDTTADTTDIPQGTGDPSVLVGTFQVRLVAPVGATAGYTTVLGKVYDGPTPAAIVWETAATEGDCVLATPRVPYCATPCGGAAVCVEDDVCEPYPTAQTVGTVTLSGVLTDAGATSFTMDPVANTYQKPGGVRLPFPAFAEGDPIRLDTSDTDFNAAFSVSSTGIQPLMLADTALVAQPGAGLSLAWTPAGDASVDQISVKLDLSHHGGSKGMITCETDDDGTLELSSTLMGELLDLGVAGFPTVIVSRKATGSTTIDAGRVDLVVSSEVEAPITIPGLVSCTDDTECPDGQTCQDDLTCG